MKRGELFPGKSDKDDRRKGTKVRNVTQVTHHLRRFVCFARSYKAYLTELLKITRYKKTDKFSSSASNAEIDWTRSRYRNNKASNQRPAFQRSFTDQRQPSPMQNPGYDSSASHTSASRNCLCLRKCGSLLRHYCHRR